MYWKYTGRYPNVISKCFIRICLLESDLCSICQAAQTLGDLVNFPCDACKSNDMQASINYGDVGRN